MNIQVSARHYSNEAEQYAAAKARRARLMGPTKRVNWKPVQEAPKPKPVVEVIQFVKPAPPPPLVLKPAIKVTAVRWIHLVLHRPPLWTTEEIRFSYHVQLYQSRMAANGHPLKTYIRGRSEDMGFSYAEVVEAVKLRKVAFARQLIMWEIKNVVKPSISLPEIGRLFGGRDHTTVMHALRKIQGMKDRGEID